LLIAGCTSSPGATQPSTDTPNATASPSHTGDSPHQHGSGEEEDHPTEPIPEAGEASQTDAVAAAERVVTVFARPTLDEVQWWNELVPLLSQKGAAAYEGTLPSNVPVTAVTGAGVVLPASTEVATLVEVPTDAGLYTVTLVRDSADQPWLAERIRPAGQ
jgi:hypothetical protein